jgi:succinyl-CoA synthetase beta subunit
MARLFEYQGKALLEEAGIKVPKGAVVSSPTDARKAAEEIGCPVAVKAQVWATKRASFGGIAFADTPEHAEKKAAEILGLKVRNFAVSEILVEEKIEVESEYYAGIIIDDAQKKPVVIFSSKGGTGIEEIAQEHPDKVSRTSVTLSTGLRGFEARNLVRKTGINGKLQLKLAGAVVKLYQIARKYEARSAEINPLVVTSSGDIVAADCRVTVDDYSTFRHPELGIEISRELDRPPSDLDKIAYNVEAGDYRGTFYFVQMAEGFERNSGYVGFHGAGGGGSMMSMDALLARDFKIANFCDTSGNPPASKVYRAAKIIMSQPGIDAYFASGSGVASQEQFHSARGLVKAFLEENLSIPAVIRLGGNAEEVAIEILKTFCSELPAPVEGYGKDDPAEYCAERLRALVDEYGPPESPGGGRKEKSPSEPYAFETTTGKITIDHSHCLDCKSKACVDACIPKILEIQDGKPVLAITAEDAKRGKCIECLACELECLLKETDAIWIDLPISGLEEYRKKLRESR